MTFTRPKIGAKVYLSRGPSGHAETFERMLADRELKLFLGGDAKLSISIEGFIRKMMLDRKVEDWGDILGYLAEMAHVDDSDLIPINIAVAFWAQVNAAREAAKAAKLVDLHVAHGN